MENKTSKYFKYAIGEIVLVVIGILIALAINSAYNASKNEEKIETILTQVQEELITDIIDAKRIHNHLLESDSIFALIMNDSITLDIYKQNPFRLNTRNWVSFSTKKGGYNQIMNNIDNLPKKYKSLLPHFNYMYVELQDDIDDFNHSIKENSSIILKERLKANPKQSDFMFGRHKDDAMEAYFNDPFLRNKSMLFMLSLQGISRVANDFRIESIALYKKIDSLLGKTTMSYPEHLTILPNLESSDSFVGVYTGDSEILGDTITITKKDGQFVFKSQNGHQNKLYWHKEDIYFMKDVSYMIKLFKNKKDQYVLYIYNARRNVTYLKTEDL